MPTYPKRLIEVDLPIKRISAHARREKSIRHGHISTLHIWWARRPLAACRAVICAALWPAPAEPDCPPAFRDAARDQMRAWTSFERRELLGKESQENFTLYYKEPALLDDDAELQRALFDFIADFANWDNSTQSAYLETSRALTHAAHESLGGEPGTRPLVLDPFAGGGSIPLEALRVGADTFASDLNPVAVLLNKVVLEYIPKYGQRLADEVRRWGQWIKEQADAELAPYYPKDPDGATPIAYLWARTITCEGPNCGAEVPLIRSLWLAKKGRRAIALRLCPDTGRKVVDFEILNDLRPSEVGQGTTLGGAAICPVCGFTTSVERVREQLSKRAGGSDSSRLIVVVTTIGAEGGRKYRLPTKYDLAAVHEAHRKVQSLRESDRLALSLVPNEPLNHLRGFFNVVLYGITNWGLMFTQRQTLALLVLSKHISELPLATTGQIPDDLGTAIRICLALCLDKQADRNSAVCRWISQNESVGYTFSRQALPMNWDFVETSPISSSGSWAGIVRDTVEVLEVQHVQDQAIGTVVQSSATSVPLPEDTVNLLFTDPPYYAAVPYADLSDFFYVWLKRNLSDILPQFFSDALSPKDEEAVALSHRAAMYRNKDNAWFEYQMGQACARAVSLTTPGGIGCFVFANKETAGWEAMLNAIVDNGWIVTASWPVDTERPGRLRAQDSAALASSIHIVCRPREEANGTASESVGDWRDVLQELPQRIHNWLPRLAREGVVGADAIFACLGPALEIFSRYARVEKASGEEVTLDEYLEYVWAAVSREALAMVFEGAETSGFEEDARLTAMWLWTLTTDENGATEPYRSSDEEGEEGAPTKKGKSLGGFVLEYDAARKIAQGLGAHLEALETLVEVRGSQARLLPVAERARALLGQAAVAAPTRPRARQPNLYEDQPDAAEQGWSFGEQAVEERGRTTLDRVHQAMLLFAGGKADLLKRFLVDDGVGSEERFWRLAQALSALYPPQSDEKRWVDGVLARKKGLGFN